MVLEKPRVRTCPECGGREEIEHGLITLPCPFCRPEDYRLGMAERMQRLLSEGDALARERAEDALALLFGRS